MITITALMEDKPSENALFLAEHGLSYYIQYNGLSLLFDCGQSSKFLHNAVNCGIDLSRLDAVILSHSHYDHAGGFPALADKGLGNAVLYTGTHFFDAKYALREGRYADLSCGFDLDFLEKGNISHCQIQGTQQIYPGVWLITGFPRVHPFETIPERFLLKTEAGFIPDDFRDEVCIALEAEEGLTVLVGCAHPGILNMLTHVQKELGKPVRAVFGGTHLVEANASRIDATISQLGKLGVKTLGLSHCTGQAAEDAIRICGNFQVCHLCSGDCMQL